MSGFAVAIFAPAIVRITGKWCGLLFSLLPLSIFVLLLSVIPDVSSGGEFTSSLAWMPQMGVYLSFYLDSLSLLLSLLISGIGVLVFYYAGGYLAGHVHLGRFYLYFISFMASMLGVVLADNVITLFVFWELTSITSFFLIGFYNKDKQSRVSAIQALVITGGGGLALFAGFLMLGQYYGTYELSVMRNLGAIDVSDGLYAPIVVLILIGCFTKSAQFPFHFWLPNAMSAPSPVSAYLHSSTMVKAGIFLLARLFPILGGGVLWTQSLSLIGGVTALVGGFLALTNSDIKRVLAYSTVSALGLLTALLGLGTEYGIVAFVLFVCAHAMYKGALFLLAGNVDHEAGTRDINALGGLFMIMRFSGVFTGLSALAMIGLFPFFSFIAKEMIFESGIQSLKYSVYLQALFFIVGALFTCIALIVFIKPFFGNLKVKKEQIHDAPFSMLFGPGLLSCFGLLSVLFLNYLSTKLLLPASGAIFGESVKKDIVLWHGFNQAFVLSLCSIAVGVLLYFIWLRFSNTIFHAAKSFPLGLEGGYHQLLVIGDVSSSFLTKTFQNGRLRHYYLLFFFVVIALILYSVIKQGDFIIEFAYSEAKSYEIVICFLAIVAALTAVLSPSRLATVAMLGIVGFSVATLYLLFGAPDLAMTQALIEMLTLALFVLVFYYLPKFTKMSVTVGRVRDALIAGGFGLVMSVLVFWTLQASAGEKISQYHVQASVPEAHGRNVVNTILVDFRALDTMGEITVLAIAALGVFALLKLKPAKQEGA